MPPTASEVFLVRPMTRLRENLSAVSFGRGSSPVCTGRDPLLAVPEVRVERRLQSCSKTTYIQGRVHDPQDTAGNFF